MNVFRRDWSNTENFFDRSWTHNFYFWKLRHVMLGRTVQRLLKAMPQGQPVRVADLGCGPGTNLFDVCDICSVFSTVEWYGLDLNLREISMGADRSQFREEKRAAIPVNFACGDILHLPFSDNSLDIIISSEVVEHLPYPVPAMCEMARVLKPGGNVMVTTSNPDNLPESVGCFFDRLTGGWLKKCYWKGEDAVSAPPLSAEAGFGHVSVHPFSIWNRWFKDAGMPVVKMMRGPMLFGSLFFDRQRCLSGLVIALDPLLDILPGKLFTTTNKGMLCRKPAEAKPQ